MYWDRMVQRIVMPSMSRDARFKSEGTSSALRSARLPVNLIGSPINYANRLIGSPITSQSTGVIPSSHTSMKGPCAVPTSGDEHAHLLPHVRSDLYRWAAAKSLLQPGCRHQAPIQHHVLWLIHDRHCVLRRHVCAVRVAICTHLAFAL